MQSAQRMYDAGRYADAERACRGVLAARPGEFEARRLLGRSLRQMGRGRESVEIFLRLREERPRDAMIDGELGVSLLADQRPAEALHALLRAQRAQSNNGEWWLWAGEAFITLFKPVRALRMLERAQKLMPDDVRVKTALGTAYMQGRADKKAQRLFSEVLETGQRPARVLHAMAESQLHEGRLDESEALFRELMSSSSSVSIDSAITGLVQVLQAKARYDEAMDLVEPRVKAGSASAGLAIAYGSVCHAMKRYEDAVDVLRRVASDNRVANPTRATVLFRLGECFDGMKEYDQAFAAFRSANDMYPRMFDRAKYAAWMESMRRTFSGEVLSRAARATTDSELAVLVVGMPRSGTTLVESILDAHPEGRGAGELPHLSEVSVGMMDQTGGLTAESVLKLTPAMLDAGAEEYLAVLRDAGSGARRVVDKMPHNFQLVGLATMMLPGASIVHCVRDPVDTCLSCYFTQLSPVHSYSNRMEDLGFAYGEYVKLMEHWRAVIDRPMLDVRYERMVTEAEERARELVEFTGLEWNEACLKFYQSKREVRTASVDQVRRPIYTSSVQRWRRYEKHLGPLLDSLAAAGVSVEGMPAVHGPSGSAAHG